MHMKISVNTLYMYRYTWYVYNTNENI